MKLTKKLHRNYLQQQILFISLGLLSLAIIGFNSTLYAQCTIDADDYMYQNTGDALVGSSFTACSDGVLQTLRVWGDGDLTGITLKIYQGESISAGNLLATINNISIYYWETNGITSIDLTSANVSVTNGQMYTFYFSDAPPDIWYEDSNPYSGGRLCWAGTFYTDWELAFTLTIASSASAPTTQATNVGFSGISTSGTTIGWTRGNGDNCAVFMTAASSGNAAPSDNTTYTASTTYGSGNQCSNGWYCVYNGSGTSVSVSNLSLETTYRVHVCEYNEGAGSELYLTDAGTDNPDNVTTDDVTVTFTNGADGTLNFQQSNASTPENDWLCGQFTLEADVTGSTLNSVTVALGGTYDASDLASTPFQIYAASSNNFGSASALGSSVADPGSGSDVTFSSLSDAIPASTRYYWVTADISASATGDDTMNGSVDASGDLSITTGTLGGSSSYGKLNAGDDASLPVDLSSFSARCEGKTIVLEWTTESETNNLGFILERSLDHNIWTTIASFQTHDELKGQGNTSSSAEYTFTDSEVEPEATYAYRLSDVSFDGDVNVYASLSVTVDALPKATDMEKAFPNPFNPQTYIAYHLAENTDVEIAVFDVQGRQIKTLHSGNQLAGNYHVYWNATDNAGGKVPTGTYIIQMRTENIQKIQKVMLIK